MSTGKTTLALLLSALLPAGAARAAGNDTLVYCSEASGVLQSADRQLRSVVRRQLAGTV